MKYNEEHGIIPKTIIKEIRDVIDISAPSCDEKNKKEKAKKLPKAERMKLIEKYTAMMREAARVLDFEQAAYFRDKIAELKEQEQEKNGK